MNPKVFLTPGATQAHGWLPTGAGAGAYEVTSFKPGEEIVLQRKKDWWGEAVYGPACIDTIRVVDIPTVEATFDALKLGEIDIMFERDPENIDKIRKEGFDNYFELSHAGSILMVYSGDPKRITSDKRIRQAMQMAIDTKAYDERVNGGTGRPTSSIMDAESPVAPTSRASPSTRPGPRPWCHRSRPRAGTARSSCSRATSTPSPASPSRPCSRRSASTSTSRTCPQEQHPRIYVNQDYDTGIGGSSMHDASPIVTLDRFWGAANRYTGFRDPAWAAALEKIRAASTDAEMKTALTTAQTIWNDQVPSVLLSTAEQGMGWRDNVHGMYFTHNGVGFFDKAYVD